MSPGLATLLLTEVGTEEEKEEGGGGIRPRGQTTSGGGGLPPPITRAKFSEVVRPR